MDFGVLSLQVLGIIIWFGVMAQAIILVSKFLFL